MIIKFTLTLLKPPRANWDLWKSLEPDIYKIVTEHDCLEYELQYDEVNFAKSGFLECKTESSLDTLLYACAQFIGNHGLEIVLSEREMMSSESQDLINNHKTKYKKEVQYENQGTI